MAYWLEAKTARRNDKTRSARDRTLRRLSWFAEFALDKKKKKWIVGSTDSVWLESFATISK